MAARVRRVQLDASSSSDEDNAKAREDRPTAREGGPSRDVLTASSASSSRSSSNDGHPGGVARRTPQPMQRRPPSSTNSTPLSTSTSLTSTPYAASRTAARGPAPATARTNIESGKPLPLPVRRSSVLTSSAPKTVQHGNVKSATGSTASTSSHDDAPAPTVAATQPGSAAPTVAIGPPPPPLVLRRLPSSSSSGDDDDDDNHHQLPQRHTPATAPLSKANDTSALPASTTTTAAPPPPSTGLTFGFRKPGDAVAPSVPFASRGAAEAAAPVPPPSLAPRTATATTTRTTAAGTTPPPPELSTPSRERRADAARRSLPSLFSDDTPTPKAVRQAPAVLEFSAERAPPTPAVPAASGLSRLRGIVGDDRTATAAAAAPVVTTHAATAVRRLHTPSSGSSSTLSSPVPPPTKEATAAAAAASDEDEDEVAAEQWVVGAGGVNHDAERAQRVDALTTTSTTPATAVASPRATLQFNRVAVAPQSAASPTTVAGAAIAGRANTQVRQERRASESAPRASVHASAKTTTAGAVGPADASRIALDGTRLKRQRRSMTSRLCAIDPTRIELAQSTSAAEAAALPLPTTVPSSTAATFTSADGLEVGRTSTASTPLPEVATADASPPAAAADEASTDDTEAVNAKAALKAHRLAAVKTTSMKVRRLLEPRLAIASDEAAPPAAAPCPTPSVGVASLSDWLLHRCTLFAPHTASTPARFGLGTGVDTAVFTQTPLGVAARSEKQVRTEAVAHRAIQRRGMYPVATAPMAADSSDPRNALPTWTSEWVNRVMSSALDSTPRVTAPAYHRRAGDTVTGCLADVHNVNDAADRRTRASTGAARQGADTALLFTSADGETAPPHAASRRLSTTTAVPGTAASMRRGSAVAPAVVAASPLASSRGRASADPAVRGAGLFRAAPAWRASEAGLASSSNTTTASRGGEYGSAWATSPIQQSTPPREGRPRRTLVTMACPETRDGTAVGEAPVPQRAVPPPPPPPMSAD